MSNLLHIVCLDAPSPPDYGGAIDMHYKIKALVAAGKKIVLHYFDYRPGRDASGLGPYCEEVCRYARKGPLSSLLNGLPYIVGSRVHPELIGRLNADHHPILLEGLHTAGLLRHLNDTSRAVVRMHNEEAAYYYRLAAASASGIKKAYYRYEARAIKRFYKRLPSHTAMACLSELDRQVLHEHYGFDHTHFVPCFLPWQSVSSLEGRGDYCLYHGNLSVAENEAAAAWLITEVFSRTGLPLVVAGKGIGTGLQKLAAPYPHIRLIADPPMAELGFLVRDAHIHVLPSLNTTGVKLKLLHALFEGRFCLVNDDAVKGSRLEPFVTVANDAQAFRDAVESLYGQPFSAGHKKDRQAITAVYDNEASAQLLNALW